MGCNFDHSAIEIAADFSALGGAAEIPISNIDNITKVSISSSIRVYSLAKY